MRFRFLAAVLSFALPALGSVPLRVTAPADGEVLRGGAVARIAWEAEALPRGVVEWEAFLSVDGGRYYGTRITPHLDIDVRQFEFRVPNVASRDVRLLIRVGDERDEKTVDVPLRLSIDADPDVHPSFARIVRHRGEPARPGDPGVTLWATGDRAGHEIGYQRALPEATLERPAAHRHRTKHRHAEAPVVATTQRTIPTIAAIAPAPRVHAASPLLARDILVLVRRRNI